MLIAISSPYRKAGLMYAKHKQYFNTDSDDTLVIQGSTRTFNKTLDENAIKAQQEADPEAGKAEWDAQFRSDLVGFLDDALIDAAVDYNRPLELPPQPGRFYKCFVDVSGGAIAGDSYTLSIVHREDGKFVVDLVRGRSGPFEPAQVTEEYAALCKEYRIGAINGDYYAAQWMVSVWRQCGMSYIKSTLPTSQIYLETLPLFTRGLVVLPNEPILLRELRLLERTPTRMGKDLVTHPRGCHDDRANSVCGALYGISNYRIRSSLGLAFDGRQSERGGRTQSSRSALPQSTCAENLPVLGRATVLGKHFDLASIEMRRCRTREDDVALNLHRRDHLEQHFQTLELARDLGFEPRR